MPYIQYCGRAHSIVDINIGEAAAFATHDPALDIKADRITYDLIRLLAIKYPWIEFTIRSKVRD